MALGIIRKVFMYKLMLPVRAESTLDCVIKWSETSYKCRCQFYLPRLSALFCSILLFISLNGISLCILWQPLVLSSFFFFFPFLHSHSRLKKFTFISFFPQTVSCGHLFSWSTSPSYHWGFKCSMWILPTWAGTPSSLSWPTRSTRRTF